MEILAQILKDAVCYQIYRVWIFNGFLGTVFTSIKANIKWFSIARNIIKRIKNSLITTRDRVTLQYSVKVCSVSKVNWEVTTQLGFLSLWRDTMIMANSYKEKI